MSEFPAAASGTPDTGKTVTGSQVVRPERNAAIAYVEKARTLKRTGEGYVPSTSKEAPKTKAEMEFSISTVTVSELCDDLLRHIQSKPDVYKDQRSPPYRINLIKKHFGHRPASTIKPLRAFPIQGRQKIKWRKSDSPPAEDRFEQQAKAGAPCKSIEHRLPGLRLQSEVSDRCELPSGSNPSSPYVGTARASPDSKHSLHGSLRHQSGKP
jgi:hypothetical protein